MITIATSEQKKNIIADSLSSILSIYKTQNTWEERETRSIEAVTCKLVIDSSTKKDWEMVIREEFRRSLPRICTSASGSSTVRFFRDVFRKALDIDILESNRHCRICTYPEGMLDTYLDEDGICSACKLYQEKKTVLEDRPSLTKSLRRRLDETREMFKYNAIVACSGGKDSVYMLTRLTNHYEANVLCVMDDLVQQNTQAIYNAERAAKSVGATLRILSPLSYERDIRGNLLRAGEGVCRLCFRSHFVRIYQVALEERIPFVFFGLTPYQLLDCPNAINWWLKAMSLFSAPSDQIDPQAIAEVYQRRALQGGLDRGFVKPNEKQLFQDWISVFKNLPLDFAPLIVPFYLFDGYPGEAIIIESIMQSVGWKLPQTALLRRTNCRLTRAAGILHRAGEDFHFNYKEYATELRLQGKLISAQEAEDLFHKLNQSSEEEAMSREELETFLRHEFDLRIVDLPYRVQERLEDIVEGRTR